MWNVGSLFRSGDAFTVSHIFLTGYTSAPPRKEITKTALGADAWIEWSKHDDPLDVIRKLRADGFTIVSLEIGQKSIPIGQYSWPKKACLIVGHEIDGVPRELVNASDAVVSIPMMGKKASLNLSVAAGIALAFVRSGLRER